MNSKLERNLKGEIGLHVTDKDTWDRLMLFYEDNGLLWNGSDNEPTDEPWEIANKNYYVDVVHNKYIDFFHIRDACPRDDIEELSEEDFDDEPQEPTKEQIINWIKDINSKKQDLKDNQLYVLIADTEDSLCFNKINKSTIFNKEDIITYFKEFTDRADNVNVYPIGKAMKMNITYELKEVEQCRK